MSVAHAIAIALMLFGQSETVQLFVGTDGCYGTGTEFVVREAANECEHGDGGWDTAVMECYADGGLYHRCGVVIELHCTEILPTPDLDQDGDVDLNDFASFQLAMTGG